MQVQFELLPFRSLLLGEYRLVSLPLHTWMLPFWRFPLHVGAPQISSAAGSPIRGSPDRRLHAATRSISQLATPFVSAQAKPFFRWRIMPNLLWNPHSSNVRGLCTVFIVIIQLRGKITIPYASQLTLGSGISLRLAATIHLPSSPFEFTKEVIRPQVPLRPPCYDFSLLA